MSKLPFAEPVAAPLAEVVVLHPDGVRIRVEERDGVELFWCERWRGTRSTVAVMYDREEIEQLAEAIARVLR